MRVPFHLAAILNLVAAGTVMLVSFLANLHFPISKETAKLYRARLEDKALLRKFGETWKGYARRTGFILPLIGRE